MNLKELKLEIDNNLQISKWETDCYNDILSSKSFKTVSVEDLKFVVHPSPLELACLSHIVYKGVEELKDYDQHGFKLLCYAQRHDAKESGVFGATFFRKEDELKKQRGQLVIAFKGTDSGSVNDLLTDFKGVVKNQMIPEINMVATFVLKIMSQIDQLLGDTSFSITITGHSLGGWYSQIATFILKYLCLEGASIYRKYSRFSDTLLPKWNPHCLIFDSPGASQILRHLSYMKNVKDPNGQGHDGFYTLDVINYVKYPNLVNITNRQVGDVICINNDIKEEGSEPSHKSLFDKLFKIRIKLPKDFADAMEYHPIKYFMTLLQSADHSTSRMTNWPCAIYNGEDTRKYFSSDSSWLTKWARVAGHALHTYSKKSLYANQLYEFHENPQELLKWKVENDSSLSLMRISERELKILEQLEVYKRYNRNFNGFVVNHDNTHVKYDEDLHKVFADMRVENGRVHFLTEDGYLIIKNLEMLRIDLDYTNLPNYNEIYYFMRNQKYRELMDSLYSVGFQSSFKFKTEVIKDCRKEALKLLLYFCHLEYTSETVILLKYEDVHERNVVLKSDLTDLFVIVDCTDCLDKNLNFNDDVITGAKHLWVVYDNDKKEEGVTNFLKSIEIRPFWELFGHQELSLHDKSVKINQLFEVDQVTGHFYLQFYSELETFLRKAHTGSGSVILGPCPIRNIALLDYFYVQPDHTFKNLKEISEFFKTQRTIAFYDDNNMLENLLEDSDCIIEDYFLLDSSTNAFEKFKALCGQNPHEFFELIKYDGERWIWEYQYNPKIYQDRQLIPPAIDLNLLKSNGNRCKIFHKPQCQPDSDARMDHGLLNWRNEDLDVFIFDGDNSCTISGGGGGQKLFFSGQAPLMENLILDSSNSSGHVILCDEAGMGKTASMLKICNNLLSPELTQPSCWVIFLELREMNYDLVNTEIGEKEMLSFLADCLHLNEFTRFCLISRLGNMKSGLDLLPVYFLFDGYDELSDNNQSKFRRMLDHLKKYAGVRIIVSSREHNIQDLELNLGTLCHKFVPVKNYAEFLSLIWRHTVKEDADEEIYLQVANDVVGKAKNVLNIDSNDEDGNPRNEHFLGVPLQLKMLSDVFREKAKEAIAGGGIQTETNDAEGNILDSKVPEWDYNILSLFEAFIDKKFDFFFNEKLGLSKKSDPGYMKDVCRTENWFYEIAFENLNCYPVCKSALGFLLGARREQFPLKYLLATGIIFKIQNSDNCQFLHRTFAEFYFAKATFDCIKILVGKSSHRETILMRDLAINPTHSLIKQIKLHCKAGVYFLNRFIERDEEIMQKLKSLDGKFGELLLDQRANEQLKDTGVVKHLGHIGMPTWISYAAGVLENDVHSKEWSILGALSAKVVKDEN